MEYDNFSKITETLNEILAKLEDLDSRIKVLEGVE